MQKLITAPENYGFLDDISIFLAGGITDCPNWQKEIAPHIDVPYILNPRRDNFPIDDPTAAQAQIEWEYNALREVDMILFWFTNTTMQPICLFELGGALERDTHLFIGIEPGYVREQDVRIQVALSGRGIEIANDPEWLLNLVNDYYYTEYNVE